MVFEASGEWWWGGIGDRVSGCKPMSAVGEVQVEVGCCLGAPSSLLAQVLAGGTSQV